MLINIITVLIKEGMWVGANGEQGMSELSLSLQFSKDNL